MFTISSLGGRRHRRPAVPSDHLRFEFSRFLLVFFNGYRDKRKECLTVFVSLFAMLVWFFPCGKQITVLLCLMEDD